MKTIKKKIENIDDYLSTEPQAVRNMLNQLRQTIKQAVPVAQEIVTKGKTAFRYNRVQVQFAVNKKHIAFYPTTKAVAQFSPELDNYHISKRAVHFPLNKPLPLELIKKMAMFSLLGEPDNAAAKIEPGVLHPIPDDMADAISKQAALVELWNGLTPIQRNEWICWVTIVKKPTTRQAHLLQMVEQLLGGIRNPCCWPGCPHRRPAAQKWFAKGKV